MSNYLVVLVAKISLNGELVGQINYHIFRNEKHFTKWYDDEQVEKYEVVKANAAIHETFL